MPCRGWWRMVCVADGCCGGVCAVNSVASGVTLTVAVNATISRRASLLGAGAVRFGPSCMFVMRQANVTMFDASLDVAGTWTVDADMTSGMTLDGGAVITLHGSLLVTSTLVLRRVAGASAVSPGFTAAASSRLDVASGGVGVGLSLQLLASLSGLVDVTSGELELAADGAISGCTAHVVRGDVVLRSAGRVMVSFGADVDFLAASSLSDAGTLSIRTLCAVTFEATSTFGFSGTVEASSGRVQLMDSVTVSSAALPSVILTDPATFAVHPAITMRSAGVVQSSATVWWDSGLVNSPATAFGVSGVAGLVVRAPRCVTIIPDGGLSSVAVTVYIRAGTRAAVSVAVSVAPTDDSGPVVFDSSLWVVPGVVTLTTASFDSGLWTPVVVQPTSVGSAVGVYPFVLRLTPQPSSDAPYNALPAVDLRMTHVVAAGGSSYWVSCSGGAWTTPSSWYPTSLPASSSRVVLAAPGPYTVTATAAVTVARLTIGRPGETTPEAARLMAGRVAVLSLSSALVATEGVFVGSGGRLVVSGSMSVGGVAVSGSGSVHALGSSLLCDAGAVTATLTVGPVAEVRLGSSASGASLLLAGCDVSVEGAMALVASELRVMNTAVVRLLGSSTIVLRRGVRVRVTDASAADLSVDARIIVTNSTVIAPTVLDTPDGAGLDLTVNVAVQFNGALTVNRGAAVTLQSPYGDLATPSLVVYNNAQLRGSGALAMNSLVQARTPRPFSWFDGELTLRGVVTFGMEVLSPSVFLSPASMLTLTPRPGLAAPRVVVSNFTSLGVVVVEDDFTFNAGAGAFATFNVLVLLGDVTVPSGFALRVGSLDVRGASTLTVGSGATVVLGNVTVPALATLDISGAGVVVAHGVAALDGAVTIRGDVRLSQSAVVVGGGTLTIVSGGVLALDTHASADGAMFASFSGLVVVQSTGTLVSTAGVCAVPSLILRGKFDTVGAVSLNRAELMVSWELLVFSLSAPYIASHVLAPYVVAYVPCLARR